MAVVLLHANGYVHTFDKENAWALHVFIEVFFYFGVPVFFMLSGANLINYRKRYNTKTFYIKRFYKTVLPYLFWSIIFYTFDCIVAHRLPYWKTIISDLSEGHIPYTNYWFFIPLFLLYIFMPFISSMVKNMSSRQMLFLCLFLFIFQSILPLLSYLMGLDIKFNIPIAGYTLYLVLGYYISTNLFEKNRKLLLLLFLLAIISLVYRFYGIYTAGQKEKILFTYFGVYAVIPAVCIFLIAKKIFVISPHHKNTTNWSFIAKRNFGVYILHTFFIQILMIKWDIQNPLFIIVSFFFAYSCSWLITYVFQRWKYTKVLLP